MRKLIERFRRWAKWQVVHCHFCGAVSERTTPKGAERIARNHIHATGHARVTIGRKF